MDILASAVTVTHNIILYSETSMNGHLSKVDTFKYSPTKIYVYCTQYRGHNLLTA